MRGQFYRPDQPLAVTPRFALDQEGFVPDQDLLLRAWVRNIRHPDIDPGGVRQEPRRPELCDLVRTAQNTARSGELPLAVSMPDINREVGIKEQHPERISEGAHQVRLAERRTCGRVQIGSGLLSISRRTHSSRSRSGIMRA